MSQKSNEFDQIPHQGIRHGFSAFFPDDWVQALPALLRVSPLYDAGRFRRRHGHRANPIPLSIIYERSLSVKEENKNIIISFRVTPEEKTWIEEHSYGHYRRISDLSATVFSKKKSSTSTEPMKLRTSFSASATISISLPVPSTQDLFGRLTSEKPNRRCKKYGNR